CRSCAFAEVGPGVPVRDASATVCPGSGTCASRGVPLFWNDRQSAILGPLEQVTVEANRSGVLTDDNLGQGSYPNVRGCSHARIAGLEGAAARGSTSPPRSEGEDRRPTSVLAPGDGRLHPGPSSSSSTIPRAGEG